MKETKIIEKFRDQLKKLFPNIFFYKIPDCKGLGSMRPFDGFFLIKYHNKKATFCFEAKSGKNKLTPYQKESLRLARKAGAFILEIREDFSNEISYITDYFHKKF